MIHYPQQRKLHNLRAVLSKDGFLLLAVGFLEGSWNMEFFCGV